MTHKWYALCDFADPTESLGSITETRVVILDDGDAGYIEFETEYVWYVFTFWILKKKNLGSFFFCKTAISFKMLFWGGGKPM